LLQSNYFPKYIEVFAHDYDDDDDDDECKHFPKTWTPPQASKHRKKDMNRISK
jgi:hypothetical protein